MKSIVATVAVALLVGTSEAFIPQPSSSVVRTNDVSMRVYVPEGFTPESYAKFKEAEAKKKAKNLGALGPRGFKSRSMQSFQEALERGEAEHLLPVFNARERVKKGELKVEDIPVSVAGR
jgi:hypothetical protein